VVKRVEFVGDGRTDSNMEGSCKCIEYTVADKRQRMVLGHGGLREVLKTPYHNKWPCYGKETCTSGLE